MKVAVTGGTGFVGSHTVAALNRAGHDVHLLVRSPEKIERALGPHGIEAPEFTVGDVTDPGSVDALLDGVDALVHGANIFTFDVRHKDEMKRVNEQGTELVLSRAVKRGLDPIIHVSSTVALLPAEAPMTEATPTGNPPPAYAATKASADRIARRLQSEGAPVVIIYPGLAWGPHDPTLGESSHFAMSILGGTMRLLNDGPVPISDVRDVAEAHARVMEAGRGPRRFIVVGSNPMFRSLVGQVGDLVGRNLGSIRVPGWMGTGTGKLSDWARKKFGWDLPLSYEPPWYVANGNVADGSRASAELGIDYTPLETTLRDAITWLHKAGHVTSKQAGALAGG